MTLLSTIPALFAILSILIWVLSLRDVTDLPLYGDPHLWHMHEMLFGYVSAVLTGFLLTAVATSETFRMRRGEQ